MNSLLRKFSTIKIAGEAEKILWLSELLKFSQDLPKPIRILGNGSNVLMDDRGLKGSVILTRENNLAEPEVLKEDKEFVWIRVLAGTSLPSLAKWTSRRGWSGCEYMVGVPGTLGGAVMQNAGANEQELKDILEGVEFFELSSMQKKRIDAEAAELSYRHSQLKERGVLVLSADLKLKKENPGDCERRMAMNLEYRKTKTPYARPSLGSTFTRLWEDDHWLYPGKLIEEAGLKGYRIGQMRVSEVHANYLINEGAGTFEQAMDLIHQIEKRVFENSGKKLGREIEIWSDD